MPRRLALAAAFAFAGAVAPSLAACDATPAPGAFTDEDDAAIRAVLDAQRGAWNRGDVDAFMAGYLRSPDLVFTSGAKIRRGWDATLQKYRESYADAGAMGTLAFSDLELHPLGPDAAWMLGRWGLTDTPKAGGGIFTLVFVRTPDGWRVAHDHTSSDPS